jgi:hypothetical protein
MNRISLPEARRRFRAVMTGVSLLAAACAAPDGAGPESKPAPGADAGNTPAQKAGVVRSSGPNGADGAAALAPGVLPTGARKPPRYNPEEFVGYKPDGLLPILGAPDFVRRDGPAQIWQYREKNCVFDVFMYREGDTSRVNHVELRERGETDEPAEACFARMRANRKPAG